MSQTAVKSFVIFFQIIFLPHYPCVRKTSHWSQHILIYNDVSDEKNKQFVYKDISTDFEKQSNKKWNEK